MSDSTMPTSEVLNRAADLIEERGWTQGGDGWYPESGDSDPVCMEGALNALLGMRNKFTCPTYLAIAAHLSDRPGVTLSGVTGLPIVWVWNDEPGRTATEVVEALRACAVIEASRERQAVSA